jgi:phosphatidylserine decarboxylase
LIILSIYVFYFFRDPRRFIPEENVVVSPADGVITFIGSSDPPKELDIKEKFIKISIFLSIFNVHVNRMPVSGTIKNIKYIEGKFLNASLNKSSNKNERNIILIKDDLNKNYIVTQIAGLIARRIICDLKINQKSLKGHRFGIIKFGSRVDLYLPLGTKTLVSVGQSVIGGETIISNIDNVNEIKKFTEI